MAAMEVVSVAEPVGLQELATLAAAEAIDELERRGLVVVHAEGSRQEVRTAHPLYGEVVRAGVPARRRQEIYRSLADRIEEDHVDVIFTELGASADVVHAVASETGARVVELATHTLPDDGSYRTFVLDLATTIAAALTAPDT